MGTGPARLRTVELPPACGRPSAASGPGHARASIQFPRRSRRRPPVVRLDLRRPFLRTRCGNRSRRVAVDELIAAGGRPRRSPARRSSRRSSGARARSTRPGATAWSWLSTAGAARRAGGVPSARPPRPRWSCTGSSTSPTSVGTCVGTGRPHRQDALDRPRVGGPVKSSPTLAPRPRRRRRVRRPRVCARRANGTQRVACLGAAAARIARTLLLRPPAAAYDRAYVGGSPTARCTRSARGDGPPPLVRGARVAMCTPHRRSARQLRARRLVRPRLRRLRCGDGRRSLAVPRQRADLGRSLRRRRRRLLLDVRAPDLCALRDHGTCSLDVAGRLVLAGRHRRAPHLSHGPRADLRARPGTPPSTSSTTPSSPSSASAAATAVHALPRRPRDLVRGRGRVRDHRADACEPRLERGRSSDFAPLDARAPAARRRRRSRARRRAAAARSCRRDEREVISPGTAKHLAALLEREVGGDQRAAPLARLDDDRRRGRARRRSGSAPGSATAPARRPAGTRRRSGRVARSRAASCACARG